MLQIHSDGIYKVEVLRCFFYMITYFDHLLNNSFFPTDNTQGLLL